MSDFAPDKFNLWGTVWKDSDKVQTGLCNLKESELKRLLNLFEDPSAVTSTDKETGEKTLTLSVRIMDRGKVSYDGRPQMLLAISDRKPPQKKF